MAEIAEDTAHDTCAPDRAKPALGERLVEGGRWIWTALVVLATIGGVLGLFQVLSGGARTEQARMLDMIAEGRLTADEAERLAVAFAPDAGSASLSVNELRDIASEASSEQRKALALIADPETRAGGISIWQAEAQTAQDWRALAELVMGTQPEVAREAAATALRMEPGNFRNAIALFEAEKALGNDSRAFRALADNRTAATTPIDRALGEEAFAKLVFNETGSSAEVAIAARDSQAALDAIDPLIGSLSGAREIAPADLDTDPEVMSARLRLARAYLLSKDTSRNAEIADDAALAAETFLALEPRMTPAAWRESRDALLRSLTLAAYAYHESQQYAESAEAYEKIATYFRRQSEVTPTETSQMLNYLSWQGHTLYEAGDHGAADDVLADTYAEALGLTRENPANASYANALRQVISHRVQFLFMSGNDDRLETSLEMLDDTGELFADHAGSQPLMQAHYMTLAAIITNAPVSPIPDDLDMIPDAADRYLEQVEDIRESGGTPDRLSIYLTETLKDLAEYYIRSGKTEALRRTLDRAADEIPTLKDVRAREAYSNFIAAERARLNR